MDSGDKKIINVFDRFDQHRGFYTYALIALYLFINNSINASSVWMEENRDGHPNIQLWEPYVWEYSSALAILLILPLFFLLFRKMPLTFNQLPKQIAVHLLASILFSLAHVGLMVAMREGVYWFMGEDYQFSPWLREIWYEYRKDAWGYVFWLFVYHVATALYKRLKGEASLVGQQGNLDEADRQTQTTNRDDGKSPAPDFLLVKKLDKEFLVKVSDIEWLESAGNYVNLHKAGRIYPLRGTLSDTIDRLAPSGFSRLHRSYGVNLAFIDNIQYQPSGDGIVTLLSGQELTISRRYKDDLKSRL
ncbi:LytTR family DNA-binding domain-containing protein [Aliiglaciecola litoralis]|uniref:LytTR family DNA-binding domain-containing protein n=1 Tax=Aliiglaciecola litoralis TaxID=582857 RepID=A0ABN1LDD3_9ALTE